MTEALFMLTGKFQNLIFVMSILKTGKCIVCGLVLFSIGLVDSCLRYS